MDLDADPEQLKQIAAALFSKALEVDEIYAGLQLRKNALRASWHDHRYNAFSAQLEDVMPKVQQLVRYLDQYSEYLLQRAQAVEEYLNPN